MKFSIGQKVVVGSRFHPWLDEVPEEGEIIAVAYQFKDDTVFKVRMPNLSIKEMTGRQLSELNRE